MEQPLREQLSRLREILSGMNSERFWKSLPLIDDTKDYDVIEIQEIDVPGLRHLKASIQKEIEAIESHLALEERNPSGKTPSTNSVYYCTLWNEILLAPRPIVALNRLYTVPALHNESLEISTAVKSKKEAPTKAKVDIVADNGRTWIRVNTTKESRLLAEFRNIEAFSYESSDEDGSQDSDKESPDNTGHELSIENYLENTVFETGRLLHLAAQQSSVDTGFTPIVHLRLSRLGPHLSDERILYTIDKLCELGIHVTLGSKETPLPELHPVTTSPYMPHRINLDLSLLIALVTDITHSPLPETREEAEVRFKPQTQRSWKRQLEKNLDITEDAIEHCRALIEQASHEMEHGLVQTIRARFQNHPRENELEFWTTEEARDRFTTIVDKIGGPAERLRAHALFSPDNQEAFWEGSRIPKEQRPKFLPIHIFPKGLPSPPTTPARTFCQQLASTCRHILSQPSRQEVRTEEMGNKLQAPTRFAARLSMHTVESLLWGAEMNMVTLTSNKTSVRLLLRGMRGYTLPSIDDARNEETGAEVVPIALWIMEPRSLSQGMRNDFETPETDSSVTY